MCHWSPFQLDGITITVHLGDERRKQQVLIKHTHICFVLCSIFSCCRLRQVQSLLHRDGAGTGATSRPDGILCTLGER